MWLKIFFSHLILLSLLTSCAPFHAGNYYRNDQGKFQSPLKKGLQPNSGYKHNYQPSNPFQLKWPVRKIKMSQPFRPRHNPRHEGVDLTHFYGAPVLAAHEGYVVYRGSQYKGYGRIVIIEYNQFWATLYGHLEDIRVKEGQIIKAGDVIGTMGNTGRSSGPHLHFELLRNKIPVNPLPFLRRDTQYAKKQ